MIQGVTNHFDYNCPVSWADIPAEYNWIVINGTSKRYSIEAFQNMPLPTIHGERIWWESFASGTHQVINSIEGDECSTLEMSVAGFVYPLNTSSCIWQRPGSTPVHNNLTVNQIMTVIEEYTELYHSEYFKIENKLTELLGRKSNTI